MKEKQFTSCTLVPNSYSQYFSTQCPIVHYTWFTVSTLVVKSVFWNTHAIHVFLNTWMRLIFMMSHFQVSQDLDESFSSLSRLGWVTFKSFKTWMSHFQVSQDLDESLSSLSRLGWGLERRWTGRLSSSVDCCYSNLLDLLRVKTRVCSCNLYATPLREREKKKIKFIIISPVDLLAGFASIDWGDRAGGDDHEDESWRSSWDNHMTWQTWGKGEVLV